jgi:hypothetical protein
MVFVLFAMIHGFDSGHGVAIIPTADAGLSGVPGPEVLDTYRGSEDSPVPEERPNHFSSGGHFETEIVSNRLDIVLFISPSTQSASLVAFEDLFSQPILSSLSPRIVTYGHGEPVIMSAQHIQMEIITSASAAYMHHITTHYNTLAEHTLFLHTDVNPSGLSSTISERFIPRTGVTEITSGGYGTCNCLDCIDSYNMQLSKTDELYALTNQNICSTDDRLLVYPFFLSLLRTVERRFAFFCFSFSNSP